MLKMVTELPVCPVIEDGGLIDIAETKNKSLSYYVDSKGATPDGQVLKCIRSTTCSYKLPLHSNRTRCINCQDVLRSCLRWQLKRSNDTFASKTAYDSHAKLSSLSHAELIARAKNLHKMLVQSQKKKGKRC